MSNQEMRALDGRTLDEIRQDFPMLQQEMNGHPLIYLNNSSTSLKPVQVLEAMAKYYEEYGVNVARGVDHIGYEATRHFECVRQKVAHFLQASSAEEIIFTRNTTEALNLVCYSYGEHKLEAGDEIIVSATEHHANYVPWQQLAKRKGCRLVLVEPDSDGVVTPERLAQVMSKRTKIVALFHMSNVLGARNDVQALAQVVHQEDAVFVVDGAQGVIHEAPLVMDWDVDFYAFSAHKILGPTGIGILYGKKAILETMPPVQFGGEMIDVVDTFDSTFAEVPQRFEAGTMPIAEVIGLGRAIDYIEEIGYDYISQRIAMLGKRLVDGLALQENIEIYNPNNWSSGMMCFNVKGIHPHDVAGVYDREGISIRAGHHCNQPTMSFLNVQSTLRVSASFYNTIEEVDRFLEVSKKAGDFLDVLF